MKLLLYPFMILSAIGLVLSVLVHIAALFGLTIPLGEQAWILHIGIFAVWLPAMFVMHPLTKEFKQKDLWKAALRGCPDWMKWMTYGFFGYAVVNFIIFLIVLPDGENSPNKTPELVFRGFSGHWMGFYSAALAVLYSALHAEERDRLRRCLNGHAVGPIAKYCEECGQPVIDTNALGYNWRQDT